MVSTRMVEELEKKLGLPKLSQITKSLESFPDAKQLKLIKEVLTLAEQVSKSAPELDQVAVLIREISSIPTEKLEKLIQLMKQANKLMAKAPSNLMDFLSSLREE